MVQEVHKSWLKTLAKLLFTAIAFYIVFLKVPWEEAVSIISQLDFLWLWAAVVVFVSSQALSAFRTEAFLTLVEANLGYLTSLRLFWVGSAYNLLFPGGLGGDAYKVWVISRYQGLRKRVVFKVLLVERLNGLIGLSICFGAMALPFNYWKGSSWDELLWAVGIALAIPVFWLVVRQLFPPLEQRAVRHTLISIGVQTLQTVSAGFLLFALGQESNMLPYLLLFLVSSIAVVVPISIGGIGARELMLAYASQYLNVKPAIAVSMGMLFFLQSVATVLPGLALRSGLPAREAIHKS